MNKLRYCILERIVPGGTAVLHVNVSRNARDFFKNEVVTFSEVFSIPGDHAVAERFVSAQIELEPYGNFHRWLVTKIEEAFVGGQRATYDEKAPVFGLSDNSTSHILALLIWLDHVDAEHKFSRWAVALFTEAFNRGKAHSLVLR